MPHFHQRPRQSSTSTSRSLGEAELYSYRWICLLAATLVPAFGVVYRLTEPTAVDPLWQRGLVALAPVSLALSSYGSAWVRKHMSVLVRGMLYGLTLWLVTLTTLNKFAPGYALGLLFTFAAIGFVFSLHLRHTRPLTYYLVFASLTASLAILGSRAPQTNLVIFISCVISIAIVLFVMTNLTVHARNRSAAYARRYRTLMDAANDAIFIADTETGRLVDANRKAQQLVGRPLEQLRGMRQSNLHPQAEQHDSVAQSRFKKNGAEEHPASREGYVQDSKGGRTPVEVRTSAVEVEDQLLSVSIFRDVTARRRYEEQLIKAREHAEEMLRLKSDILNNMSHEVRTPLTGILGFADVLAENTTGENQEFAGMIAQNAHRLQKTLNSVLDMARLERGELVVEMNEVDVLEEARDTVSLYEHTAQQNDVALSVQGAPARTHLDAACLHRILNNLVGNALKFTDEGRVTVTVEEADTQVQLHVRDTGVGIEEEFLPHLFDEFRQQSVGLGRVHEGSGLGLAITERLVELMDGTISVESEVGIGTTFTVSFPREPERRDAERPGESTMVSPRSDGSA